jgi:hypothetical protein
MEQITLDRLLVFKEVIEAGGAAMQLNDWEYNTLR